jgi:hypothetical protein
MITIAAAGPARRGSVPPHATSEVTTRKRQIVRE